MEDNTGLRTSLHETKLKLLLEDTDLFQVLEVIYVKEDISFGMRGLYKENVVFYKVVCRWENARLSEM